jgi:hypothetical protein
MAKPTEGESKPQCMEKYTNKGFLKPGFRVPAYWGLKKMFTVSTLSFHAGMAGEGLASNASERGSFPRFRIKRPCRSV